MIDTPRKLNALVLIGIGILLLNASRLEVALSGASNLVMLAITVLPLVGVIFFVLGVYRFFSKEKDEKKP